LAAEFDRFVDGIQHALKGDYERIERILVIGCGSGGECVVLLEAFYRASLLACDLNDEAIELTNRALTNLTNRATANVGNASELLLTLNVQFDLIVVRHANVDRLPQGWARAFAVAASRLTDAGYLVATTYTLTEAIFVSSVLERLGLQMLEGSPYSSIPVAMSGADRYILAYQKYIDLSYLSKGHTGDA